MLAASGKIFTLCFDTLGDWKITSSASYRKLWMWTKSITLYVKEHSLNKLSPVLMWIFFESLERSLDRIIFNHISSRSTSPLTLKHISRSRFNLFDVPYLHPLGEMIWTWRFIPPSSESMREKFGFPPALLFALPQFLIDSFCFRLASEESWDRESSPSVHESNYLFCSSPDFFFLLACKTRNWNSLPSSLTSSAEDLHKCCLNVSELSTAGCEIPLIFWHEGELPCHCGFRI